MPLTTAQRVLNGRIGAAIARSRHDPRDLTAAGRASFLARFERQVREESPELPDAEVQRRAGELRRAFMLRLALRSSVARARRGRPALRSRPPWRIAWMARTLNAPKSSSGSGRSSMQLIEAEACARQAARLCEAGAR